MKAHRIIPGVVYGYQHEPGDVAPVVFLAPLDAGHLYQEASYSQRHHIGRAFVQCEPGRRVGRGRGYPAVRSDGGVPADALTRVTLAEFESADSTELGVGGQTVTLTVITSVAAVVTWTEKVNAAYEQRWHDEQTRLAVLHEESSDARAQALALVEALAARGITASVDNAHRPTGLLIALNDVGTLLAESPEEG
ncbi:hypothetical protein [Nonomuraea typhae]|uniref:hypothetical protein n=1 Tax=Nonomuraea typhae TaxID=2603600 RepID=UPI0012FB6EB6|nr:hypothetical protein [Nonomuraea typhae]